MAYDVMITGMAKDGQPLFELNPAWSWDTNELMEDARFTMEQENSSYTDYVADLDLANMRALHEHFRPYATKGVWSIPERQEEIQPMMKLLDTALYEQPRLYDHFHVMVYEWESGSTRGRAIPLHHYRKR